MKKGKGGSFPLKENKQDGHRTLQKDELSLFNGTFYGLLSRKRRDDWLSLPASNIRFCFQVSLLHAGFIQHGVENSDVAAVHNLDTAVPIRGHI